jgi:Mitochondrial carrier protein
MAEVAAPTAPAAPGWKTVILAGGMSGMMVDFVLFPLDSLKTYLQTRTELRNQSGLFGQGSKRFYRGTGGKRRRGGPWWAVWRGKGAR